ncbi:hypothetical protein H634G_08683 [Metarhizium anisopliae BRIP 53293]|uniref:Uncharacterized protein n=1 Tax=Metarhizium anisopliae BRIP 53293 TaxID=1291518 RepID=A0A0D9NPE1_METAN|nr:hypothetical protein H634G_08683 [Metarhizium anisopliae BRIP 53293]KJK87387.1 hypothetical protein H633G_08761 [Metarhizium anisopliae BRIP 53284]
MKPTAVLVGVCIPALASAFNLFNPALYNVRLGFRWKFIDGPESGLKDITFPVNMAKTSREQGYYLSQQFGFHGVRRQGHIAIQPRPDNSKGQAMIRANFTSHQAGTATCHPACQAGPGLGGAEGSRDGVTCAIDVPADYAHTFNLTVENVRDANTWRGLLVDTVTRKTHEIGVWTLPSGAGDIQRSRFGFVEYIRQPGSPGGCENYPKLEATIYHPWSNSAGAGELHGVGSMDLGMCGKNIFKKIKVTNGFTVYYGRA